MKELWTSYVAMRNNYRAAIRKTKQENWTNFCNVIQKGAEATRLNKLLSRNPEVTLGALKLPNGAYSRSVKGTLACLIGAHFPVFKRSGEGGDATPRKSQKLPEAQLGPQIRLAHEIATPAAVRWTLKSFSPCLLQRAGEPIIGPLVRLARASLALGYITTRSC